MKNKTIKELKEEFYKKFEGAYLAVESYLSIGALDKLWSWFEKVLEEREKKTIQMSNKTKETRKLRAGYEVDIYWGPFSFVLRKGKDTWSDSIRALSHLTNELENREKEIKSLGNPATYKSAYGTTEDENPWVKIAEVRLKVNKILEH